MPDFNCEKCGASWSDTFNFSACPQCSGFGRIPEGCTCSHFRLGFGKAINVVSEPDPDCPVHKAKMPEIVVREQKVTM